MPDMPGRLLLMSDRGLRHCRTFCPPGFNTRKRFGKGDKNFNKIFASHQLRKISDRGFKCQAEHWMPDILSGRHEIFFTWRTCLMGGQVGIHHKWNQTNLFNKFLYKWKINVFVVCPLKAHNTHETDRLNRPILIQAVQLCEAMTITDAIRGRPLIIWGAWCKTEKKNSFGGSPEKKIPTKGIKNYVRSI